MQTKLTLIYWQSGDVWKGKLAEFPHIIEQGETLEELEHNLYGVYEAMVLEGVDGEELHVKEFVV